MSLAVAFTAAVALAAPAGIADTKRAICTTFGRYCGQALSVSWCESRWNVYARSPGGHLGLFQFGSYARRRYGFGWDAWTQSRAAYRYFADSGHRWTAWSCKP